MWEFILFVAPGLALAAYIYLIRRVIRWVRSPEEESWERTMPMSWRKAQRYW